MVVISQYIDDFWHPGWRDRVKMKLVAVGELPGRAGGSAMAVQQRRCICRLPQRCCGGHACANLRSHCLGPGPAQTSLDCLLNSCLTLPPHCVQQRWAQQWELPGQPARRGCPCSAWCPCRHLATQGAWRCSVVSSMQAASQTGHTCGATHLHAARWLVRVFASEVGFICRLPPLNAPCMTDGNVSTSATCASTAGVQESLRGVRGRHDALNSFAAGVVAGGLVVGHYQGKCILC